MRQIKKIVVHSSDQATNYPSINWDKRFYNAESIEAFHVEHNGWDHIGYHWVVLENGRIEKGCHEEEVGYHVKGENAHSIGICMITQDNTSRIAIQALNAMRTLAIRKAGDYGLSMYDIYTHNYFDNSKVCPGFSMIELHKLLRR